MIGDCTAIILTGGQSKRMGQDKAGTIFQGKTLLQYAENNLQSLFADVRVSTRQQRSDTSLPQILDHCDARAPILGIVAALQAVNTGWVFVIGVDMPFLSKTLVEMMAKIRKNHHAVAVFKDGLAQPLCCFYHQSCLPTMQENIEAGKRSLKHFLKEVDSLLMPEQEAQIYDPNLHSFVSLDTPSAIHYWSQS